jgi:phosphatidylserine/phosphatidylglycerophosphate/cardiolipin synthase-like enzyme
VIDALEKLMKGRTVITIAHRLSTIRHADKIIVVKGGVVAEEGSHDELLARSAACMPSFTEPRSNLRRRSAHNFRSLQLACTVRSLSCQTIRRQPLVDAIAAARQSLRIKMFLFSDPGLLAAVIDAQQRGVKVRVMLNPARRSGEGENEATRKTLEAAGVEVVDSNPAFDITHEKSLVVDGETAFVHSLNWETKNLTETRDYAVVTSHRHEVDEIVQCFDADWNREPFDPGDDAHLIWCNINGRNRVARFIDSAEESLFLQNERYQDEVIIERLVRATRRGVKLHVLARPDALSQEGQARRRRRGAAHPRGSWAPRCTA